MNCSSYDPSAAEADLAGAAAAHQLIDDNFKYTLPTNLLSHEQRAFYEKNGFLVIPKLVPDQLLDRCRQRFLDIIDGKVPKGNEP
jgi:hypothetical protein